MVYSRDRVFAGLGFMIGLRLMLGFGFFAGLGSMHGLGLGLASGLTSRDMKTAMPLEMRPFHPWGGLKLGPSKLRGRAKCDSYPPLGRDFA